MPPPSAQPSSADSDNSLAPSPLLSVVSYNHDILKLRLARLHFDFLYNYKLYTERTVDDNRRAEFTRGHSIHIPGYELDTYPIRKVWAHLFDSKQQQQAASETGKEEQRVDEDDEEVAGEERARQQYAPKVAVEQHAGTVRTAPSLGLPHHLFRSEEEREEEERDEAELTEQRLARKRARREQWRHEIKRAVEQATRRHEPDAPSKKPKAEVEEETIEMDDVEASAASDATTSLQPAGTKSEAAAAASSSPVTPARMSSPGTSNRSPSPSLTPGPYASSPGPATSNAIPSLCEECGSRIDSMWSQCDFCGFDPLLSDGEEEEGAGKRRRKRGRAARIEKLMAQTAQQEKKAKNQQDMKKLMETMSPWEAA